MRPFIHDDFLLESEIARRLYHEVAAVQPIIDYHNHLDPGLVAADHHFRSMTELWLEGDHYKWRALRANGELEHLITGKGSDWEKFQAWARVVPDTLRNPLYHWTHLELAHPFGIRDRLLTVETARGIYDECNEKLQSADFSTCGLLAAHQVEVLCTTDDPTDPLEAHLQLKNDASAPFKLLPTWRPDAALQVAAPAQYNAWLNCLEQVTNQKIASVDDLLSALKARHDFFHESGCRLADHGMDEIPIHEASTSATSSFLKIRAGAPLSLTEQHNLRWTLFSELARMNHQKGWVQQLHIGALRDTNSRLLRSLGPNTGFDSINDQPVAAPLAALLDNLDSRDQLAKTILYNLNPADNEVFATMIGNFQDGSAPGKLQHGAAWWFLDQLDGIEKQLNSLSNMGLLARFVGMLTDSRSFVSFSRHEYFRRILCNLLGQDVDRGRLPNDFLALSHLVQNLCYGNARRYFDFW